MRKTVSLILAILAVCLWVLPTAAASDAPVITLQPQSAYYPENAVAIYTVKAEGTNLQANWYLEFQGKTYSVSEIGSEPQPWEGFAGASYGARKLDDNTFAFIFEGIGAGLNDAYLWCVLEDGHFDVASQKARIFVGDYKMPPEIISIPTMLTVEQGDEAEIRCVAKALEGSQLTFLWYETDTGKMEDLRAVNRGEETSDTLFCDTATLGTRNYLCMVQSSVGGTVYSSLVPVTVQEKQAVENGPTDSPDTQTTESAQTNSSGSAATDSVTNSQSSAEKSEPKGEPAPKFPWWGILIIAVAAAGAGFGAAVLLVKKKG